MAYRLEVRWGGGMVDAPPFPLFQIKDVGPLGLLATLWDELGFSATVDACIPCDEQVTHPSSIYLKALVLNLLSGRDALYRVESFFEKVPVELLLGPGVESGHLNDDALGRHLDRLQHAGGMQLFNALSLKVIEREQVDLDRLHADTTSKLLFGEYAFADENAISVTFGHSKDHRPDLKQIMAGVATTVDGVPVLGELLDGNQSDKTWHRGMLERVRSTLKLPETKPLHYVGDSALITQPNLEVAAKHGIAVTGRLPRTVGACDEVIEEAITANRWEALGALVDGKEAATYQGYKTERTILEHQMQVGVYRSSAPNERVEQSVLRRQQGAVARATKAARELEKKAFGCDADAQSAVAEWVANHQDELIELSGKVVRRKVEGKFGKRGRPKAGDERPVTEQLGVELKVEANAQRAKEAIKDESCFVLVHTGKDPLTLKELLSAYKGQSVVETRFPFLKDAKLADVFFVKMPKRVEALGYVMLVALLLWSVWERRIRRAQRASGEPPLKDTTGMKKLNPTATVCSHILEDLKVVRLKTEHGFTDWRLAAELSAEQARVYRFTGITRKW